MPCKSYRYNSGRTNKEQECRYRENKVIGKVTRYGWCNGVEGMLDKTRQQPITIAVYASAKAFGLYKSGVIQRSQCLGGVQNHAVTVVGYKLVGSGLADADDEADLDLGNKEANYWLVQNSWGPSWGDNGFVRLNIDNGGKGVCGMNQFPLYVDGEFN